MFSFQRSRFFALDGLDIWPYFPTDTPLPLPPHAHLRPLLHPTA